MHLLYNVVGGTKLIKNLKIENELKKAIQTLGSGMWQIFKHFTIKF